MGAQNTRSPIRVTGACSNCCRFVSWCVRPPKPRKCHPHLDLRLSASQTFPMAHTYMLFDFGADEEKAQQARHKLEGWKQAFRLDKKLQVKFDRGEEATTEAAEAAAEPEEAEEPKKGAKSKTAAKGSKAAKSKKSDKTEDDAANSGPVKLFVRLYFSSHEK